MWRVACSVKMLSLGGLKRTPHQVRCEHIPILRGDAVLWAARPLRQEVVVLEACLHGMDHELVPAVELHDDEIQETADFIEAKPELPCRIVIVEVCDIRRLGRGGQNALRIDPVLEGRRVNF